MAGLLEASVQPLLDLLPDSIPIRTNHHGTPGKRQSREIGTSDTCPRHRRGMHVSPLLVLLSEKESMCCIADVHL